MSSLETELYPPVKAWLEATGFEVKSEIEGCDIVARRGDEAPVIVELKTRFNLDLLLQGVDRLRLSDRVYIAFPRSATGKGSHWRKRRRAIIGLCRRLGVGLLIVDSRVEIVQEPEPYRPRGNARNHRSLMLEFDRREGDPNIGGSTRRAIVTAYRQDALRCLDFLRKTPGQPPRQVKLATGVERAASILQRNVYGWFYRQDRASYIITPQGEAALTEFADALKQLTP
tara:strand:+ start:224 stop:907 length:684 start_codon:yes stop_codon:yes gene_type:complete